jgi:hypothetical protein
MSNLVVVVVNSEVVGLAPGQFLQYFVYEKQS